MTATLTTTALATIGTSAGINPDGDDVRTFDMRWDGELWSACYITGTDEIHLARTCRGCWSQAGGHYAGMWNSRKHRHEAAATFAEIVDRAAVVQRLIEAGERETAAKVEDRVAVIVGRRGKTTAVADLIA